MCGSMVDIQSPATEIRRGKKRRRRRKIERNHRAKIKWPALFHRAAITRNAWQSPAVAHEAQRTHCCKDTPLEQSTHRVCCLRSVICNEGVPFRPYSGGVVSAQRVFCPWWPWPLTFHLDIQSHPSEGPSTSSMWIWRKSVQRFLLSIVEYESQESNVFHRFRPSGT